MAHVSYIECDGPLCPVRQTEDDAGDEHKALRWQVLRVPTQYVRSLLGSGWQADTLTFCTAACLSAWLAEHRPAPANDPPATPAAEVPSVWYNTPRG